MTTNQDIIHEARTCLDTPWHHVGRVKGVGLDCVGLIAVVANKFNIPNADLPSYSRMPDGHTLVNQARKTMREIRLEDAWPGDIPIFCFGRDKWPTHIGMFTDVGLIHTYTDVKKVTEHCINSWWWERIAYVFRLQDVEFTLKVKPWQHLL
jgi:cell wall-associated NlpC family hydrolase